MKDERTQDRQGATRTYGPFGYEKVNLDPTLTTEAQSAIRDAFVAYIRRAEPDAWVEAEFLDIEHEGDNVFVLYDDPAEQHKSFSPRTFAVSPSADGYRFEEV